ncbi:uncharacterized protein LOC113465157 [Ceratina calcarata]|uniref:Uncharacterized protein LOC113465157 n=1 Tax=Ceratina calcarata TaxID=156304 RepID=A0AAJ7SBG2_9HYME|nr:uncharacterized protein LOC113465157 [Ceratina calcarata]
MERRPTKGNLTTPENELETDVSTMDRGEEATDSGTPPELSPGCSTGTPGRKRHDSETDEEHNEVTKRRKLIEKSIEQVSKYLKLRTEMLEKKKRKRECDEVQSMMAGTFPMLRQFSREGFLDFYNKYCTLLKDELKKDENQAQK